MYGGVIDSSCMSALAARRKVVLKSDAAQISAPPKTQRTPERGALPSSAEALARAKPYVIPEKPEGGPAADSDKLAK